MAGATCKSIFLKEREEQSHEKELAVMALAAATLSMMAMPVYADDLVTVGYAQVGHESDWRTANTQNYQDVFSEENGYSLDLVDCDNDNAAQLEAVRTFISKDMDYIVIAPIQSAGWDTVLQVSTGCRNPCNHRRP